MVVYQRRAGHAMLPRCLAVILLASFFALRDVTFAAKLRLSLPERLDVTEGANLTINCSFSPLPTDPYYVIVKWSTVPAFYPKNTSIGDIIQIHNSGIDIVSTGVAAFVGDVAKGDCSVRLPHASASLSPVFGCMVFCGRCNTDDAVVAGTLTLNVTVAAPDPSAPLLSSTKGTSLAAVAAAVAALGLVAGAAAVVAVFVRKGAPNPGP